MEIQQLRGFWAIARFGNFTTAAQKTFRSQPTISLQIKTLEDELGVKLFERVGSKKVMLTKEGAIFLELIAPIMSELETVTDRFKERLGIASEREVTLVTTDSVMVHLLPAVLKKFKKQFPKCQLIIKNAESPSEIVRLVSDSEADIGIISERAVPPSIIYEIISRSERVLVTPKDHPLAKKKSITLKDIADYPLILPTRGSNTRRAIERVFSERNLEFQVTMEVVGRQAIKTYVSLGLGISIMNDRYLNQDDRTQLFVRHLSNYFGKSEAAIITRRGRALTEPAKVLKELVMASAAN